ncbi:MAG: phosphate/phosphite/phosphonate ABC transporter substrate-binding protein [Rivularia sp. (in: Bacteria)]|nr:phosphate/phosphite/phosphonate ABC transporter substrate-binding protein [Rivularia sp. MS3]
MRQNNHLSSKSVACFLVAMIAFLNASCSTKVSHGNSLVIPAAVAVGNKNTPPLKIGVLPTQSLKEQQRMIQPLEKYLENSLETEVNFQVAADYKQVMQWLVDGKIDMAYVAAVSYLEALDAGANIEPLVAPIDKYTGRPWYRAAIVVKVDSNIETLHQLKGKRFAFVNKFSTSGYLMPFTALNKLDIHPQREFKTVIYPGTHAKTLEALENGEIDAAATNIPYYLKQQKMGKLKPEKFRVIWESPPIPPSLIVVSKKLSQDSIKKLKISFLNTPEGIEDIFGGQSAGYTSIEDSDYMPIRELRAKLNMKSGKGK